MPPMQGMPQMQGVSPQQSIPPVQNGYPGQPYQGPSGMPMVQQVQVMPEQKKDIGGIIKIVVIVILSLIAVTFIGLFIWMFTRYDEVSADVDAQIAEAVRIAKDERTTELNKKFENDEKYPYKTFAGPVDYGGLNFEYPKTWNLFVEKDAVNGGNFSAYLNPGQVDPISNENINALRVEIRDQSFDQVVDEYKKYLDNKKSELNVETIEMYGGTGNLYSGVIPRTEFRGFILVFKIRDKTVLLQTDSVLFEEEFRKLIETIKFNE